MYCSFFGLQKLPFKISPDLSFFYKQASRDEIVQALRYSVERGDGIIKVVGEVGVGKTTLLRLLVEQLPNHYQKVYISSPNLSALDLLKFICSELNLEATHANTKLDLINHLNTFLIKEYSQGRRVVMLIDESQSMTLDTLEEIRLLGNLETEEDKLLQMVLFGQPELDLTLEDSRIKPLKDRIACNVSIPPLNAEEVMRYLNYRMRVAGYMGQDLFNLKIAKHIQKLTHGLPRSINLLADKLLMVAYSKGDHKLKLKHFKSLDSESPRRYFQWGLSFGLMMIVVVLGWGGYSEWFNGLAKDSLAAQSITSEPPSQTALKELQKPLSFMTPLQLSEKLGVGFDELSKMVMLKQKTERFIQEVDGNEPVILMSAMPIKSFDSVYSTVLAGLSVQNRKYLFAIFKLNYATNHFEYQLLYYPRATRFDVLQEKQQDLAAMTDESRSSVISATAVDQMIQQLNNQGKTL
ncbi:AAA family ATPase [Hydrogenovibrio sp. 3SP14C1]|uniref:ExeA family protein n=1 Tax=Hydrogenovibrio sp. 3SP14C1 TaxID=3038774 RepID=UPI002416BB9E|nr:AAA family ATPase [Hydrogenovibrio sp. 3SP14C1]MDG4811875.1 AAA family ATPase [Hydrogenovibrio sp. 3SP14C1]